MFKKLLLITLLMVPTMVLADKPMTGRSPAVVDEAEEYLEYSLEEDEVKEVKLEAPKNKVSVLIGQGVVDSSLEIDPTELEFFSEEEKGLVLGLEYVRKDVFKVNDRSFNISGQVHSNQTALVGIQSRVWKLDVALLAGVGIVKHESVSSTDNLMNPRPEEANVFGPVGGLQLSVPVYENYSLSGQITTNGNVLGGIGIDF